MRTVGHCFSLYWTQSTKPLFCLQNNMNIVFFVCVGGCILLFPSSKSRRISVSGNFFLLEKLPALGIGGAWGIPSFYLPWGIREETWGIPGSSPDSPSLGDRCQDSPRPLRRRDELRSNIGVRSSPLSLFYPFLPLTSTVQYF